MTVGLLSFANQAAPIDQAFLTPFSNNSPWNVFPVSPVLGSTAISTSGTFGTNFAAMQVPFNSQMFNAVASDPPNTVSTSILDEGGATRTITVPHWPSGAVPATGSDHHMEIYDSTTKTIYAFWNLVNTGTGTWSAGAFETYDAVNGTGWASPSRPSGPRASGVAAIAGMPRTWEQDLSILQHALPFGIDGASVQNLPVFPSTSQDPNVEGSFNGPFPYGTLFMLPPTFNLSTLGTSQAQALARTLMKYGGYLVDTTSNPAFGGGGFNFYGEIGSTWPNASNFNPGTGQNTDLVTIRNALRAVTSVSGWLDRNNNPVTPVPWAAMNLLSMRGPWTNFSGGGADPSGAIFNTISKNYEFPDTTVTPGIGFTMQTNRFPRDDTSAQPWLNWLNLEQFYINPTIGANYTLKCLGVGSSSASAQFRVYVGNIGTILFDSGNMAIGAVQTFNWPSGWGSAQIFTAKGPGPAGAVRLELTAT